MTSRMVSGLLLLLVGSSWCLAGDVRSWTDKQGRTIRAEFVRVHDGRVVLKSGSQTQMVPLSQLSQQDQDYIESQLNRKARKDGDEPGQPIRIWTDTRGNQITASFVRMNDTQAVLNELGKPRQIPFMELSEQDRKHIKDLLRGQGEEQQAAALERHEEEAAKAAAAAAAAAAASRPSAPAPSLSPPSASPSNPFMEEMRQRQEQQRQEAEQRRQEQQRLDAERRQRDIDAANQRQAEAQQRFQEQQERWKQEREQTQQRIAEQSRQMHERLTNLPTGPTMVTEYICSNCRKTVPENIGAGGNCPHCGIYFNYSEGPGGQRSYASTTGGGGSSFHISGRAIRGLIMLVVLLGGGVAALWRKLSGG